MAMISGIFPSYKQILDNGEIRYDRAVDEKYFARYHAAFLSNGVYTNKSTSNFQVKAVPNSLEVTVEPGSCFINGYFGYDDEMVQLSLTPTTQSSSRIDAIVACLDHGSRQIAVKVKEGQQQSNGLAQPPQPERNDKKEYELVLAYIHVKGTEIERVEDTRPNKELCGFVSNTIENIDTTGLFSQYNYAFEKWFSSIKNTLSGQNPTAELAAKVIDVERKLDGLAQDSADALMENDNKIGVLESKVDKANEDSGWIMAKLENGFRPSLNDLQRTPKYRKIGKMVEIIGEITPPINNTLGSTKGMGLFTLPEEFRPKYSVCFLCQADGISSFRFTIHKSGFVEVDRYRNENGYYTPSHVNGWLPIHGMYFVD